LLHENFADRFARASFDDMIGIEKREVQLRGDDLSDRRFAGPHKTDERNILNLACGAHGIELADLAVIGTQFLNCRREPRPQQGIGSAHSI
jgi:hypothetical protein